MLTYPVNLRLTGQTAVVVGAGSVGTRKIDGLLTCGAHVVVFEPHPSEELIKRGQNAELILYRRAVSTADISGAMLVFACTNNTVENERIAALCADAHVLCNVVDNPARCSFTVPSVVYRPPLQIAISTEGQAPSLAKRLRQEMEVHYDEKYARYAHLLGTLRALICKRYPQPCLQRTRLIGATTADDLFNAVMAGQLLDPHEVFTDLCATLDEQGVCLDDANQTSHDDISVQSMYMQDAHQFCLQDDCQSQSSAATHQETCVIQDIHEDAHRSAVDLCDANQLMHMPALGTKIVLPGEDA